VPLAFYLPAGGIAGTTLLRRGKLSLMKARRLIAENGAFGPAQLAVIGGAFELAWLAIQAEYEDEAARESARIRLATICLELAGQGILDPEALERTAVEAMKRPLD
jgi:hypothetical protein